MHSILSVTGRLRRASNAAFQAKQRSVPSILDLDLDLALAFVI